MGAPFSGPPCPQHRPWHVVLPHRRGRHDIGEGVVLHPVCRVLPPAGAHTGLPERALSHVLVQPVQLEFKFSIIVSREAHNLKCNGFWDTPNLAGPKFLGPMSVTLNWGGISSDTVEE